MIMTLLLQIICERLHSKIQSQNKEEIHSKVFKFLKWNKFHRIIFFLFSVFITDNSKVAEPRVLFFLAFGAIN